MTYVAVKGGTQAVLNAEQFVEYFRLKGESEPIRVRQLQDQMRQAVDRVMGEGGLYAPELAALALKQSEGDTLEASFLLRAYRSTVPRIDYSMPLEGERMRPLRRVSATFKDIPGGQILGPTRDYQLRLLNKLLMEESSESVQQALRDIVEKLSAAQPSVQLDTFPKVIASMRAQGILQELSAQEQVEAQSEPYDVTRKALTFPAPRSARLQVLAQADTGSLLTFAYSSVRGYGDIHPTLGELRYGYLPVEVQHPLTGEPVEIGEIMATECEMVSHVPTDGVADAQKTTASVPKFSLGYGFSFGQSEIKAMSMSMLDRSMSAAKEGHIHGEAGPAGNEEFVLLHVDGIEASGFTAHFKLPHYVTFQSSIDVLEHAQEHQEEQYANSATQRQLAVEKVQDLLNAVQQKHTDEVEREQN